MTTGEMLQLTNRFKEIMESKLSRQVRDIRLAVLMTDLESAFHIPMLKKDSFEKENPYVMQLFWAISEARTL